MADEKELGLNQGEEKTPAGGGLPADNAPGDDELDTEIDKVLGNSKEEDEDDDDDDEDEDTVVISKTKLEKLKSDRNNYRDGLKSVKTKIADRKAKASEAKAKTEQPQAKSTDEAVQKDRDKQAIEIACEDAEINDNWNEIMKHYKADGRDTVAKKVKGIQEARDAWKSGSDEKDEDKEDKGAKAKLATDGGKPAGESGKEGDNKERKHVLPPRTPVKEWYK